MRLGSANLNLAGEIDGGSANRGGAGSRVDRLSLAEEFRVRFAMGFCRGGLGFSAFSSLDLMQVSDAMMEEMMSLTGGDEDECAATMEVGDIGMWSDEDDVGGTTWLMAALARKRPSGEGEEEVNRTTEGSEATERGRAVKKEEDTERLKHRSRSVEDFPIQHLI
ncbi:hypothetical protein LR48_Vigan05g060500 [Vigna angularis]|uniref:Uncharacterized protein n=1 Tax=Phaseolus angularis TaxID=3914 RepID=A0A0L9UJZ8_PHAAN|nr:hypothetical protein LR48_Vigan05g060500 [Vigna angularis]